MRMRSECSGASVQVHRVSRELSVSAAPSTERDVQNLACRGYRSVIDLRSADEPLRGVPPHLEAHAAEAAGLSYHRVPVSLGALSAAAVDRVRLALVAAEPPTLLHCGSGRRAWLCALIHLGCQNRWTIDQCLDVATEHAAAMHELPTLRGFLDSYLERDRRAEPSCAASGSSPSGDSYRI